MAKYSYEFKRNIVDAYDQGKGGYRCLSKRFHINESLVKHWITSYHAWGDEGLMRSRENKTYTFEYKLHVVELYLTNEVSYQELALAEGIRNPSLITRWVNDFRIAGPAALRAKKKGRKKTLDSPEKKLEPQPAAVTASDSVTISREKLQQMEDELLKLKIQNAYLKELRRLRLEENSLLKKKREPSTASEDHTN